MKRFILVSVLIAVSITGCSGDSDEPTLTTTKSPAQLLRNEITSRVPDSAVQSEPITSDRSESCDSAGLVRSWRSEAIVPIVADQAPRLRVIAETLVASFVDQGWTASTRDASSRLVEFRLTSSTSASDVRITADAGVDRTISIVVNGPCVQTGGPDSDEVKQLEGRH